MLIVHVFRASVVVTSVVKKLNDDGSKCVTCVVKLESRMIKNHLNAN